MLSDYIINIRSQEQLRHGIAGAYLDGFTDWLAGRGYGCATIRTYLWAAARFATWAQANHRIVPSALDQASLVDYRAMVNRQAKRRGKSLRDPGNAYCGARTFVRFLREQGHTAGERDDTSVLVQRFRLWMKQHRGAGELTLTAYVRVLNKLIAALGGDSRHYTAAQLRAFVLQDARGFSHSKAQNTVSAVRMFVRFLIVHQECPDCLRYAIPPLAGWRQASLPRYVDAATVARIIDASDPSTVLGARDRAVLLLLSRLALRAGDVAGLRLDDIDWVQGRLSVAGKNRRQTWLPMPQDVGDAILHYLHTARPAVVSDGVFLITRAPYTAIMARQVSSTAERGIRRAGVNSPSLGAHVFRHSAATQWLREGLSLQAIGTLLRHCDVDTTAIYAKVDVNLLRQIALPWPEENTPC